MPESTPEKGIEILSSASRRENEIRSEFRKIFFDNPIPENEILFNLGLFCNRQLMTRFLFINDIYRQIVPVPGVVMEFGCRWGQNLALFETFRGIYEPFNHNRRFVGFDTFEGFCEITPEDGEHGINREGAYAMVPGYEEKLEKILSYHEQESPVSHIQKFQLRKGDASEEIVKYLDEHPETIVAMAFFDMDVYAPTKACLEAVIPHLTKGSLLVFDELNYDAFPGETLALKDVLGLDKVRIQRSPYSSRETYIVWE